MSMNEFRRLAAKIDQHMQQLSAQGVSETHAVINCMMGYVPGLHRIWVGTSDQQLMALSHEFPGFYRYALIMEEASEAERNKASRAYDGMAELSEEHKQRAAQLLVTAATLKRGFQAFNGSGNLQVFQPQVNELGRLHRQWLSDLDSFKNSLREEGAEPKALEYANEALGRLAERIKQLTGRSSGRPTEISAVPAYNPVMRRHDKAMTCCLRRSRNSSPVCAVPRRWVIMIGASVIW